MDRLLIVDGHAYAYRAFHAIRELRSPSGQPTNAIYGFIKMLGKMRAGLRPTHLIVVWDGGLCEQRTTILPEYKAQRPEMPLDLKVQLDGIVGFLNAAGIASFCGAGIEADDYIACLARQAEKEMGVVIASSDKDFMQLVSDRIGLLNPNDKTETVWTAEQVKGKTGILPNQIVDWLSLRGDSADNIAGVPGVGPKTATDLLTQFGTIDGMYGRLSEIKSDRLRLALVESESVVRRNQKLVALHNDLECHFSREELAVREPNRVELRKLYEGWGVKGLLAELGPCDGGQAVLI